MRYSDVHYFPLCGVCFPVHADQKADMASFSVKTSLDNKEDGKKQ